MTGGPAGAPGDEGVSGASERPRALGEREAVDPARLAEAAVGYLPGRRWFRSKARTIRDAAVVDRVDVPLAGGAGVATVAFVAVAYTDGTTETYALPVVAREAAGGELEPGLVVSAADGPPLVDAFAEPGFARALLDGIGSGTRWRGDRGEIVAAPTGAFERLRGSGELAVRRTEVEQSNSSVVLGERLILKLYRRPDPAPNPEVEVGRFLTERGFPHAPAVAGSAEYLPA
ncbi:MAG TPA: hypothetical protein VNJ28_08180, partial [Candidatus Limnocylindrales bacterium]|nr:hypothetical protein [Candidatus Limnocylindrales bacterium]